MSQPASPIGVFVTPVTPLQQNCTTVWCTATNKAAVIDPGGSVDVVLGEVTRRGLTLDQIWITHGHLDHAGGAAEMQEKTGVRIVGPQKADQFWIDRIVVGLFARYRKLGQPLEWVAVAAGFVAADLVTGSTISAALLLRYSLGLSTEAGCIEQAVDSALEDGVFSADIAAGGEARSTRAVTDAVLARVETTCQVAELRD